MISNLVACVLLYALLEYCVHRWDMHRGGSYRYESHTVKHHGRMEMGVEEASLTTRNAFSGFLWTLPITCTVSLLTGWSFIPTWGLFLIWASLAWTAVHRHIHGEAGYRYAYLLCPWLPVVRWNHLRHHGNPRYGFGGLFWFLTDPVLGTSFPLRG